MMISYIEIQLGLTEPKEFIFLKKINIGRSWAYDIPITLINVNIGALII